MKTSTCRVIRGDIVTVGQAEKAIEALARRQESRLVTQVPFPDHVRCIPCFSQQFGNRNLIRMQTDGLAGKQDMPNLVRESGKSDSFRVTTGHQGSPGRCTHR